ncbi:MAG: methyltransferase domain-containing protein [Solirubrobacterales bacterium]|nr:methyltransferase domain-containing protein [Solirubrobacterales bacterium]
MNLDSYRAESLATWAEMAPGWEGRREWLMGISAPVNDWLLGAVDPQEGESVLELAAGTGDLGFAIAERVGPDGRVISSDFAPEMVDVARRVGAERELGNVRYEVIDAERIDLPDDHVDAVVCRWGYMLMSDPAAALAETRRVLKPGGRLAFAVWTAADRNPWAALPAMTLIQAGHMELPEPGTPGILALADPDRIRELLHGAGFDEPALEEVGFTFRHPNFADQWATLRELTGPLARIIDALSESEREAVRTKLEAAAEPFRTADGGYAIPASSWGVLAR